MKKVKLLFAAMFMAVTLGLPAKAVFAAAISLTQADFTEACATPGTETAKGVYCDDAQHFYSLKAGSYTLGSDLTLSEGYFLTLDKAGDYNIDLNNHKITGKSETGELLLIENTDKNTTIANGGIFSETESCAISIKGVKTTLSSVVLSAPYVAISSLPIDEKVADITLNDVATNSTLQLAGGKLTVNGGSFVATGMSAAAHLYNVSALVNGGIFSADGASAMYYDSEGESTLTIVDGTFVSEGDNGIEFSGGNLSIAGGSFTGRKSGINLAHYDGVILSGGTYKYTGTGDEGFGAIAIFGEDDPTLFTGFLADNYRYNVGTASKKSYYTIDYVALTSRTDSVVSTAEPTPEEESSSSDSSIGAPDSGRSTKESASATTNALATLLASSVILGGIYAGKKALAKKA